ncbi:2'-5' RNA ligase family protein [Marimonas sp. MJW-29]|uniref:2'-5' RNA ligase family protein n=1 Tax=Sulfitobacter sediminis TaxID=3234186 RepID=A0ABV3RLU7_9RHOB
MIYVLAYPEFSADTARRIAHFRALHEPARARLVAAHITLVFGLSKSSSQDVLARCEKTAPRFSPIPVEFTETRLGHDPFEDTYKLFLMCETGRESLTALHDLLYDGPQRAELSPDIPYEPHMTVATHEDRRAIAKLDTSALGAFPICATIRELTVVRRDAGMLQRVGVCTLGR